MGISLRSVACKRAETHAAFLVRHLSRGLSILDCGCGSGTITAGLASAVNPGVVVGIDVEESLIEQAQLQVRNSSTGNLTFEVASAYVLPFEAQTFDVVFSHGLFERLSNPAAVLAEFCRVLRPGGKVAVSSPDWGGSILAPAVPGLSVALEVYMALMRSKGSDPRMGRRLAELLVQAGFSSVVSSAQYETYEDRCAVAEDVAEQLDIASEQARDGQPSRYRAAANVFRDWCKKEPGLFAHAWVTVIAAEHP